MATNTKQYEIELDILQSDETKRNIMSLRQGFDDASKSVDDLSKQLLSMSETERDITEEVKAYNAGMKQRLTLLEKENDKLLYSMTEQGKADRERLAALEAQETLTKKEAKERDQLAKRVVKGTDAELKARQASNKQERVALKYKQLETREALAAQKLQRQQAKDAASQVKTEKTRLAMVKEYVKQLKLAEKAQKALSLAGRAAKGVAKVGIGVAAGVGAVAGMAVSSASDMVAQEQAMQAMRYAGTEDERLRLYSAVRIATGASADSIVSAVNRAVTVLGKGASRDDVENAAIAEIRMPGTAMLFQTSKSKATGKALADISARLERIQGATGTQDLSSILEWTSNKRLRGLNQLDIVALSSALRGSSAFDSDDQIQRAMSAFIRQVDPSKDIFDQFAGFDFSRYALGAQNKEQVRRALASIDIAGVRQASRERASHEQTAAEKTQSALLRIEDAKNQFIQKIAPSIGTIFDTITRLVTPERIESFAKLIEDMAPFVEKMVASFVPVAEKMFNLFMRVFEVIEPGMIYFFDVIVPKIAEILDSVPDALENVPKNVLKGAALGALGPVGTIAGLFQQKSEGGLVTAPSIVGERGPELVLPMDYSRSGRTASIVANFNQSFSLSPSAVSAGSLATASKTSFVQAFTGSRLRGF